MKRFHLLPALIVLVALSVLYQPAKASAESMVYVGIDLGTIIAAFDHGPRYVYPVPVVHERHRAWRPAPRVYHPVRHYRHAPPPDRYRHQSKHRADHHWNHERRDGHRR